VSLIDCKNYFRNFSYFKIKLTLQNKMYEFSLPELRTFVNNCKVKYLEECYKKGKDIEEIPEWIIPDFWDYAKENHPEHFPNDPNNINVEKL
jgi:hypothetical protein